MESRNMISNIGVARFNSKNDGMIKQMKWNANGLSNCPGHRNSPTKNA